MSYGHYEKEEDRINVVLQNREKITRIHALFYSNIGWGHGFLC